MDMQVTFAGGMKVNARIGGHTIPTDQSVDEGGFALGR